MNKCDASTVKNIKAGIHPAGHLWPFLMAYLRYLDTLGDIFGHWFQPAALNVKAKSYKLNPSDANLHLRCRYNQQQFIFNNGTWADLTRVSELRGGHEWKPFTLVQHISVLKSLKSHFCHTCLLLEGSDTEQWLATLMTSFTASLTNESLSLSCKQTHHLVPLW